MTIAIETGVDCVWTRNNLQGRIMNLKTYQQVWGGAEPNSRCLTRGEESSYNVFTTPPPTPSHRLDSPRLASSGNCQWVDMPWIEAVDLRKILIYNITNCTSYLLDSQIFIVNGKRHLTTFPWHYHYNMSAITQEVMPYRMIKFSYKLGMRCHNMILSCRVMTHGFINSIP